MGHPVCPPSLSSHLGKEEGWKSRTLPFASTDFSSSLPSRNPSLRKRISGFFLVSRGTTIQGFTRSFVLQARITHQDIAGHDGTIQTKDMQGLRVATLSHEERGVEPFAATRVLGEIILEHIREISGVSNWEKENDPNGSKAEHGVNERMRILCSVDLGRGWSII